jgi:hypothetical protein
VNYLAKTIALIVCGTAGAALGWALAYALDWNGVGGALVAAAVAMVIATMLWAGGVAVGNRLRPRR